MKIILSFKTSIIIGIFMLSAAAAYSTDLVFGRYEVTQIDLVQDGIVLKDVLKTNLVVDKNNFHVFKQGHAPQRFSLAEVPYTDYECPPIISHTMPDEDGNFTIYRKSFIDNYLIDNYNASQLEEIWIYNYGMNELEPIDLAPLAHLVCPPEWNFEDGGDEIVYTDEERRTFLNKYVGDIRIEQREYSKENSSLAIDYQLGAVYHVSHQNEGVFLYTIQQEGRSTKVKLLDFIREVDAKHITESTLILQPRHSMTAQLIPGQGIVVTISVGFYGSIKTSFFFQRQGD